MDPSATLDLIANATDADDLREACENLAQWLARGGHCPGPEHEGWTRYDAWRLDGTSEGGDDWSELLATLEPGWCVRWNLPGCMPDSEPQHCVTWDDARASLHSELENLDDECESEDDAQAIEARECVEEVSALKQGEEWSGMVGHYVYVLCAL